MNGADFFNKIVPSSKAKLKEEKNRSVLHVLHFVGIEDAGHGHLDFPLVLLRLLQQALALLNEQVRFIVPGELLQKKFLDKHFP